MDAVMPIGLQAQRTLDEDIIAILTRTQNSLSLLQADQNAIAPIFRLPNEILVDIFLILRNSLKPSLKRWHHIAQICRHWRHVVIEAPILWTEIHVRSHDYTLLMLERSQKAPLDVHFVNTRFPDANVINTIPAVLSEIERVRTLTFAQKTVSFLQAAQTFLRNQGRQALILESLTIECSEPGPAGFNFALDSFSPTVSLRQLSLSAVRVDWNILPITNLTRMNFTETCTPVAVTAAQLISALQQMANLEELSIALDDIRLCHYGPNRQLIDLPCLKSLAVYSDRQDHIQFFLSHIIHPQLNQLLVHCLSEVMGAPAVNSASIITSVAASMKQGDFGIPWGLDICQNDFRIYQEHHGLVSNKHNVQVSIPITGDERGADTDFAVITDILTCVASLNRNNLLLLRQVYLAKELAIPTDQLIHLFGFLPHLEKLDVGRETGLVLAEALTITFTAEDGNLLADIPIVFPALQSITWRAIKEYVSENQLLPDVLEELYTAMSTRLQRGRPISKLVLVEYGGLDLSQIEMMMDVVQHVYVRNDW